MSYENGTDIEIRPAGQADAEAINELLGQLGYPQEDQTMTATRIETWAEDPTSMAYVADTQDDLQGLVAVHICPYFEHDGAWGRIVALVVSSQSRGRGVAGQLVTAAESFARDGRCVGMELTSANRPEREAAHRFYRNQGYVALATGKTVLYRKSLLQAQDD